MPILARFTFVLALAVPQQRVSLESSTTVVEVRSTGPFQRIASSRGMEALGWATSDPPAPEDDHPKDSIPWSAWWEAERAALVNLRAHVRRVEGVQHHCGNGLLIAGELDRGTRPRPSVQTVKGKVEPALLEVLERPASDGLREACLLALARMHVLEPSWDHHDLEGIARHVGHSSSTVHEAAVLGLGVSSCPRSVPTLARVLADPVESVRSRVLAARGLGLIAHEGDADTRRSVHGVVAPVLRSAIDVRGLEGLAEACVDGLGLTALDPSGDPGPVELIFELASLLSDQRAGASLRAHVGMALVRLVDGGGDPLRRYVVERLTQSCASTVGADLDARPALVLTLGEASRASDHPTDAGARSLLLQFARFDVNDAVRMHSRVALAKAAAQSAKGESPAGDDVALRFLQGDLASGDSRQRAWTALALGVHGATLAASGVQSSEDTVTLLLKRLLSSSSKNEIGAVATALGLLEISDVQGRRNALRTRRLAIPGGPLRDQLNMALGLANDRGAAAVLRADLFDLRRSPAGVLQTCRALALMGDKELLNDVISRLNDERKPGSRATWLEVIGLLGDARAVDPLLSVFEDESASQGERSLAARSLGLACARRSLQWEAIYANAALPLTTEVIR